jgi:hypothetical protein
VVKFGETTANGKIHEGGRKVGSENKIKPMVSKRASKSALAMQIVADMNESWNEPAGVGTKTKGQAALQILFSERPADYAKLFASTFIPKDVDVTIGPAHDMGDDEIDAGIARLREQIAGELAKPVEQPLMIEASAINDKPVAVKRS